MVRGQVTLFLVPSILDVSASRSVISVPNSTIVVGTNMLIGGLLKVIVPGPDRCDRC